MMMKTYDIDSLQLISALKVPIDHRYRHSNACYL